MQTNCGCCPRSTFPSIIELVVNEIFDKNGDTKLKGENLRTIKMKFLDFKKSIISERFYFSAFEVGPFIKTENIELVNILALCTNFQVDLSALLKTELDSLTDPTEYHINVSLNSELYHLCWPHVISMERQVAFNPVYYSDDSEKCLNRHSEFIVEYKDSEILKIKHRRRYFVFNEQNMKEIFQFMENYEQYVAV